MVRFPGSRLLRTTAAGLVLVAATLALSACGGGSSTDPAGQIREAEHQMLAAIKTNNIAKMCSFATKPGDCLGAMALAKVLLGSGKLSDLMTDKDLDAADRNIDTDPITVSEDGTHATVKNSCAGQGADCTPSVDKWVKIEGEWKAVFEDN